jgi:arabinosaccharide transport system substrate-binding protein
MATLASRSPARSSPGRASRRCVLGAAGTVVAACSAPGAGQQQPSGATTLAGEKNATLEAWCHSDARSAWQKKTLDDYNQDRGSNVQVTWTNLGSTTEVSGKLVVTTAAGSGFPDLADVEISQMGKLLKTSSPPLVAYNDFLKGKEGDLFKSSALDPWSLGGKYYGIGNELNVCLFAYRRDLLDRAGIKTPIATWDDALQAGKKIVSVAEDGLFWVYPDTTRIFHILAIQAGGGFLDKGAKLIINSPGSAKALQYLYDVVKNHAGSVIPSALPAGDPGATIEKDAENNGKIAAMPGPSWYFSGTMRTNAPDTGGNWMVQPLPQWSAGQKLSTSQGGTGMTVLKDGKYKDTGVDFVIYEHTNKTVLHDYELRQVWPTYRKAYDDPRLNEMVPWFNNQRLGALFSEAADTMLPFFQGVWWPEIDSGAGKHLKAAILGDEPIQQALEQAQQEAIAAIQNAGGTVDADGTVRS